MVWGPVPMEKVTMSPGFVASVRASRRVHVVEQFGNPGTGSEVVLTVSVTACADAAAKSAPRAAREKESFLTRLTFASSFRVVTEVEPSQGIERPAGGLPSLAFRAR